MAWELLVDGKATGETFPDYKAFSQAIKAGTLTGQFPAEAQITVRKADPSISRPEPEPVRQSEPATYTAVVAPVPVQDLSKSAKHMVIFAFYMGVIVGGIIVRWMVLPVGGH